MTPRPVNLGLAREKVVKILRSQDYPLSLLGDPSADTDDVLKQSTNFIAACYSVTGNQTDMSSVRKKSGLPVSANQHLAVQSYVPSPRPRNRLLKM